MDEMLISKGELYDPKKEAVAKLRNEKSALKEKLDAPSESAIDTDVNDLRTPDELCKVIVDRHRQVDDSEAKLKQMEDNLAAKKASDQKFKNELGRQHTGMIKPMNEKLESQKNENDKVSKENEEMKKKCEALKERQSKVIENQKMAKEMTSILNKVSKNPNNF